ncbi:hypothetical protein C0989_001256 [Termitomyces sp. Mn162]|nr:hypothetical protein C0989_001256 [Termitomyces sp. Mn162]
MSSQVGILNPAALLAEVMEVDDEGPEAHPSDMPSSLSSALGKPEATLTSKGKGKVTATSPSAPAQESITSSLTTWNVVKQDFSVQENGKGKVKEPKPLTAIDEQIAHLL